MSALILIELNGSEVSSNSRAAITAATQLSDKIDALVLTDDSANAVSVASLDNINTVKVISVEESGTKDRASKQVQSAEELFSELSQLGVL